MKKRNRSGGGVTSGRKPRSRKILERGIRTRTDYANLMSELMTDILEGDVPPREANRVMRTIKIPE